MKLVKEKEELLNEKTGFRKLSYYLEDNSKKISNYDVVISGFYGNGTIEYYNCSDEEGKGYTKAGLRLLIDEMFSNDLVSTLSLDISKDNLASINIANSNGFIKISEHEYVKPHPEATRVYGMKIERLCNMHPENIVMYTKMMEDFSNYLHYIKEISEEKSR